MAGIHTFNAVFVFVLSLGDNLEMRREEKKAPGDLSADVWSGHCECREVRGQEKCSETVIGQSGPCPLVELSIVWM